VRLPGIEDSSAWRGKIAVADLPDAPELRLDLYAVESDRMRVHPLGERIALRRAPGGLIETSVEDVAPRAAD
jgi:hypothetical protein